MLRNRDNRNKKCLVFAAVCMLLLSAGCGNGMPGKTDIAGAQADGKKAVFDEAESVWPEAIAEIVGDIYAGAVNEDAVGSLETLRSVIAKLGEQGYTAVDSENQIDMTNAEKALAFCEAAEKQESADMTLIVLTEPGFHIYDLKTQGGYVNVGRTYFQYDQDGQLKKQNEVDYTADLWQYTEEGYLFFGGSYFSDENYVLTLSDAAEYTALRILPLDETCRELNRKYILPAGYERNNIFLTDWDEEDFDSLDLYDIFDRFYPVMNGQANPYTANGAAETESVYEIPEEMFEAVVTAHFGIDRETLRAKTVYLPENASYEYRPRGFYEAEYPEIPYPEVVGYTENDDGTITLTVNAVYPKDSTSKSFSHKTVIRPLSEGGFQFVSNDIISPKEDYDIWWHTDRLTDEEREAAFEGDAAEEISRETSDSDVAACLLNEREMEELKQMVLTAARQVQAVYRDIELTGESFFGSNIREFTGEQRREVVSLLGKSGYVSVTDDVNMQNYEKVEDFYAAYRENRDAMVTLYNVDRDGLIGAITFLHRYGKLQTYYVGISWREGGVPEIQSTSVSDIAEMRLTEKGYLIYAYENVMPHTSLRQYWRVKPLSEKCRELTIKYVYGLSYVNYNVLVTNWDSENVEDILMPCMFEDIYRIDTGENIKPQNGRIPAQTYERIMTTYFPVSVEQLRKICGYDEKSGSYAYDMIFSR